jgi:hypothetical protein
MLFPSSIDLKNLSGVIPIPILNGDSFGEDNILQLIDPRGVVP